MYRCKYWQIILMYQLIGNVSVLVTEVVVLKNYRYMSTKYVWLYPSMSM